MPTVYQHHSLTYRTLFNNLALIFKFFYKEYDGALEEKGEAVKPQKDS